MGKELTIRVEKDHIDSLAKATGVNALAELIWNSLDADATRIEVNAESNHLGYDYIEVTDNGHGIKFTDAEKSFETIGGSAKKHRTHSPRRRRLHGKEGKGRFKAFTLGDLIQFVSTYQAEESFEYFKIIFDRNKSNHPYIEDPRAIPQDVGQTGFSVQISNVNQRAANQIFSEAGLNNLAEKFALYYRKYPDFEIIINGITLDLQTNIKTVENLSCTPDNAEFDWAGKLVIWNQPASGKLYLADNDGFTLEELDLGFKAGAYQISLHIESEYFRNMIKQNRLELYQMDPVVIESIGRIRAQAAKKLDEIRRMLKEDVVSQIKDIGLYPFDTNANPETIKEFDKYLAELYSTEPKIFSSHKPALQSLLTLIARLIAENEIGDKKTDILKSLQKS